MEATVWVDALERASRVKTDALLFSIPSSSSSSHSSSISTSCLRPFNQNFQMQNTTMAIKATPPITPPTMAPIFGPDDFVLVLTSDPEPIAGTQAALGQVSQSPRVCRQTSSDLQEGHVGASLGQGMQFCWRGNMERYVRVFEEGEPTSCAGVVLDLLCLGLLSGRNTYHNVRMSWWAIKTQKFVE